jgi:hypothetical protein
VRRESRNILNQLLELLFPARDAARAEQARNVARFAVLGAFVFGLLPASVAGLAQMRKAAGATADTSPVKKTAKTETVGSAKKAESAKVDMSPIRGFITRAKRLNDEGKLDLSKPQTITVEGERQEDGTLTDVQITGESASNPEFRRVADDFVASVNQSHALKFLDDVSHMRMVFTLDGERFRAETASETPTPERADAMARGYRMMLNFARIAKRGTDEAAVMSGMKISSSGKQLLMNLDMPREQMGNILLRQITPN